MNPFELLLRDLSSSLDISILPDTKQSCLLVFSPDDFSVQIDLDQDGERILIGSQLGTIPAGQYREQIFLQALRVNGGSVTPRGTLAYSEKNNTLVLFQFFSIDHLKGETLRLFLEVFHSHGSIWKEALSRNEIPIVEQDSPSRDKPFGNKA